MSDCIFCKIIKGEIPGNFVYQDDKVVAIHDINPAAPVHILIIPREHIQSVLDFNENNSDIVMRIFEVAAKIARQLGVDETGFRIVTNTGEGAGQTVPHLHYHLLGGRSLQWPPG